MRRGMADGFEWAFEGEQNQVCETEQSSVNKDRHMKYAQSGTHKRQKQGGTAGVFLLSRQNCRDGDFVFRSGKRKGKTK